MKVTLHFPQEYFCPVLIYPLVSADARMHELPSTLLYYVQTTIYRLCAVFQPIQVQPTFVKMNEDLQ